PSGFFQINNIDPGSYYLLISKSGYQTRRDPSSGSFNIACSGTENRGTIYLVPDGLSPPQNLSWYNDNSHPHLTWDASSGPTLTGYNVYRNLGNGYVFIAFVPKPTTNYLDTDIDVYGGKFPPNYAYYYVTAVDPESDPSNTARVPTNQATLVERYSEPRVFTVLWDSNDDQSKNVPAGVYLYRLESAQFRETKRMLLVK
ncbi:MAG: hypothetical protein ACE5OR_15885, partial [bacterium]